MESELGTSVAEDVNGAVSALWDDVEDIVGEAAVRDVRNNGVEALWNAIEEATLDIDDVMDDELNEQ